MLPVQSRIEHHTFILPNYVLIPSCIGLILSIVFRVVPAIFLGSLAVIVSGSLSLAVYGDLRRKRRGGQAPR